MSHDVDSPPGHPEAKRLSRESCHNLSTRSQGL